MRKPNYKFERKTREIQKQEKKAAKLAAKRERADEAEPDAAEDNARTENEA